MQFSMKLGGVLVSKLDTYQHHACSSELASPLWAPPNEGAEGVHAPSRALCLLFHLAFVMAAGYCFIFTMILSAQVHGKVNLCWLRAKNYEQFHGTIEHSLK